MPLCKAVMAQGPSILCNIAIFLKMRWPSARPSSISSPQSPRQVIAPCASILGAKTLATHSPSYRQDRRTHRKQLHNSCHGPDDRPQVPRGPRQEEAQLYFPMPRGPRKWIYNPALHDASNLHEHIYFAIRKRQLKQAILTLLFAKIRNCSSWGLPGQTGF